VKDWVADMANGIESTASYLRHHDFKLRSSVADAVPGFREQYEAIERRCGSSAKPQP